MNNEVIRDEPTVQQLVEDGGVKEADHAKEPLLPTGWRPGEEPLNVEKVVA